MDEWHIQILKRDIRLETATKRISGWLKKLAIIRVGLASRANKCMDSLASRANKCMDSLASRANKCMDSLASQVGNHQLQRLSTRYLGLRRRHQNRPRLHQKIRAKPRKKNQKSSKPPN